MPRFVPTAPGMVTGGTSLLAVGGLFLEAAPAVVATLVVASAIGAPLYWRWHYRAGRRAWEHRTRAEIFRQAAAAASQRVALEAQRPGTVEAGPPPSHSRTFLMLTDLAAWGYGLVQYVAEAQHHLVEDRWAPACPPPPPLPLHTPELSAVEQAVGAAVQWLAEFCDPKRRSHYYGDLSPRTRRERWTGAAATHARAIWRACEEAAFRQAHHTNGTRDAQNLGTEPEQNPKF